MKLFSLSALIVSLFGLSRAQALEFVESKGACVFVAGKVKQISGKKVVLAWAPDSLAEEKFTVHFDENPTGLAVNHFVRVDVFVPKGD